MGSEMCIRDRISCEYEELKDVTISSVQEGVRSYEWIAMDDAEFVNGKFKLNANQFGSTSYQENEPFLNPDKVLYSQRGEKFGHKYTLAEFIITLLTIIVPFGICVWSGFLYSRFIYKLDAKSFYEINQFTYVYSTIEKFFWDIFLNKTNNVSISYDSIHQLLNETTVNESHNFNTKSWLKTQPNIYINFKSMMAAAHKVVYMLPDYSYEQIVQSGNFTLVTNTLQFLTDYLFHRGYSLIDGYHSLIVSHEKSTKVIFLVLEISFGVMSVSYTHLTLPTTERV